MTSDPVGWLLSHLASAGWLIWIVVLVVVAAVNAQRKALGRGGAIARRPQPMRVSSAAVTSTPAAPPPAAAAPPPPRPASVTASPDGSIVVTPQAGRVFAAPPSAASAVPARPAVALALGGAFGDPAHARTAVVLSELLAPPVALR